MGSWITPWLHTQMPWSLSLSLSLSLPFSLLLISSQSHNPSHVSSMIGSASLSLSLSPLSPPPLSLLSSTLRIFTEALGENYSDAYALFGSGVLSLHLKEFSLSRFYLLKYLYLVPTDVYAIHCLAMTYALNGWRFCYI